MKKSVFIFLLVFLISYLLFPVNSIFAEEAIEEKCFSYCVSDYSSGLILYAKNEHKKHEIGSMVKIMTLNIFFEELENNTISLDEEVYISDNAASMGGSQMFLDKNTSYKVSDLIKGIVVCSANDAAYAIGERISGDINSFINLMNNKAKEYGMNNTLFANSTGLPSNKEQYSTAFDINIATKKLMEHDKYYDYAKIWYEDFVHPSGRITRITNTNKLLKRYNKCICAKTGYTNEAGFCISAGAKKDDFKVISTVIGGESSDDRFNAAISLFNRAFSTYSTKLLYRKNEVIDQVNVIKGKENQVNVYVDKDVSLLYKENELISDVQYNYSKDIEAPFLMNQNIGYIEVKTGDNVEKVNVLTCKEIQKKGLFDYFSQILTKK